MPYINSTEFGHITIDNQKYGQVLIIGDQVKERDYDQLKELFGTSHKIGDWEVADLLSNQPQSIIIGTGQQGVLTVDQSIIEQIKEAGIELKMAITPQAINLYNQAQAANQQVNALIHTTC